jgi:hypothetical protein
LGNRSPQVTIFSSVYDAGQEPGATLPLLRKIDIA